MIKFFRKIRYDLMSENKTSKYFKYAIGEIVLVVIGILIALSINNWNENRKEIENQRKLFSNLKIDFQNRLNELEDFYNELRDSNIQTALIISSNGRLRYFLKFIAL